MRNPASGNKRGPMRISRQFRRDPRRGALPAVLAAFALLIQLLIPAAAMAHEARAGGGPLVVMCTAEGPVSIAAPDSDGHGKGFAGLQCHDCVMASVAAVGVDLPLTVPVRYASLEERIPRDHDRAVAPSRAPPRPPSTAPPAAPNA